MREDLNKALIERPRRGHKNSYKQIRRSQNDFDLHDEESDVRVGTEGMRRPHKDRKNNSDLWGVIRRFMASCVGRHWDDVFSEVNRDLRESDDMRAHFLAHVRIEVDEKLQVAANGRLYRPRGADRDFKWKDTYPNEIPGLFKRFYVDPRDGILKKAPEAPKGWVRPLWRRHREEVQPEKGYEQDDGVWIKHIDGIWYEVVTTTVKTFRWVPVPNPEFVQYRDNWTNRTKLAYSECDTIKYVKRQLNTKELRKYGVQNAA